MIIGVAGKIASGKSTLARAVAVRLKARRLGFGDYVRSIAELRGLDASDRAVLQSLGQDLVAEDPAAFVHGILSFADYVPGESIVFDGVRHRCVWEEIERVARRANNPSVLVFLGIPEELRRRRLVARAFGGETPGAFDGQPSETDLEAHLREIAELILDARLEVPVLVDAVVNCVERM
jgi:dephospho-CoA kinase